ncbi:DUF58 domain-containing protein [Streptomyces sp. WMMC1477]|uniref:DUF58 domain-containing protein n=1 Tax=Streptomyces sp. WMMC1477 TaxID=3015155 RepID=UPI0022B6774F|nr:DUF58 domain-containing protein [Streptomyces sp. WMMC1477]MCZ7431509.1 DUF58 domain-containing protein [Streptomyces sp. WMMC1477]
MALTGRSALVAALGTLVAGLLLPGWTGLLAVQLPLALAMVYDLIRAAPVRTLQFTRSGDTSVRLGASAAVRLTLVNPSPRPLRATVRDAWPPSSWRPGTEVNASRRTLTVPPGERRRILTVLTPTRRGDRKAARVTVRSHGPLGLAARQGSHEVPWTVRVLPAFASRRHLPAKLARLRELDGRTSVLTRGEGTEFDSLREYIPGDDTRSIDWRATARQSTVAVRTWRPERDRRVVIVLDTGRTAAGRVGDVPRMDAAMDAALLLASLATRAGDRVSFLAHDRRIRAQVQGRSSKDVLPAMVEAMAPLEAALIESDADAMVSAVLGNARHRSLIVLLTGLDAAPVEEGLLPAFPLLMQRHSVIVASVADPRIEEMARARGTVDKVYEAAAAAQTKAERHRAADQLRRHGATVIEAPPADLPPALADAYLALKASGRL